MGNCIRKESSMQWGGEDWSFPFRTPETDDNVGFYHRSDEDQLLMGESKGSSHVSSTSVLAKEVKVKITKKQLSELTGKEDVQGLSVHQLLTKLMNVSERFELHHNSWRPALQSIPEDS